MTKITTISLRIFGLIAAAITLVAGGIMLVTLFIIGAFARFSDPLYATGFLLYVLWFIGTILIAIWLVAQPSKGRAIGLALLLIPMPIALYIATPPKDENPIHNARIFVANEDVVATATASARLLERGPRSDPDHAVTILLDAARDAPDDAERIRLLCLLARVSYRHAPVIAYARELKQMSADDSERVRLHEVAVHVFSRVNPHEGLSANAVPIARQGRPEACR